MTGPKAWKILVGLGLHFCTSDISKRPTLPAWPTGSRRRFRDYCFLSPWAFYWVYISRIDNSYPSSYTNFVYSHQHCIRGPVVCHALFLAVEMISLFKFNVVVTHYGCTLHFPWNMKWSNQSSFPHYDLSSVRAQRLMSFLFTTVSLATTVHSLHIVGTQYTIFKLII